MIILTRVLLLLLVLQTGCIWKLWTDDTPLEEKIFDVYGTVETISPDRLVLQTRKGERIAFRMLPSSVKGSDFGSGAYVHVYYRVSGDLMDVTMVVEKR